MRFSVLIILVALLGCDNRHNFPANEWVLLNGSDTLDGRAFLIDPSDVIFIGTFDKGIFRSTDGGLNWIRSDSGFSGDPDVRCFGIDSSGHILAGSYDYVFRSTDDGVSWHIISTFGSPGTTSGESYVSAIGVSPQGDYFYTRNRGSLYRSTDEGASWDSLILGDGIQSIVFSSGGSIFTGSQYCGNIMRSTDNGSSWDLLMQACVYPMQVDHRNDVYAGTVDGLLKTTDGGDNWYRLDYDVAADTAFGWGIVYGLLVDRRDRLIAVSDLKGEVFASTDHGATWRSLGVGLPVGNISRRVAVDSKGFIYVKTDGAGIFKSTTND